ncbi:MAG: hypothetical protein ACP5PX_05685 [Candidatus Hadarchaeum sp.]|uniref:hypothetical protein n=1 Tax=Candidatus Hadarchaeum sp. TaxID=2883567 RepID=UPI003D0BD469
MGKFPSRFLAGVVTSIAVFVLVLLMFNLAGWPFSPLTLIITVGLAWFFAAGLAGKISGNKWCVAVPTVLAVGLIGTTLVAGVPWDLTPEEMATFKMEASFTYLGSENNLPIENVALRFPCPNVENVALFTKTFWSLYYLDEDNVLILEADQDQVYSLVGERTASLNVLLSGVEDSSLGPKIYYKIDKLYPREVFQITTIAFASKDQLNKVTIRTYGDNFLRSLGSYQTLSDQDFPVNFYFLARLFSKTNGGYKIVEKYSRHIENSSSTWLWLYPN